MEFAAGGVKLGVPFCHLWPAGTVIVCKFAHVFSVLAFAKNKENVFDDKQSRLFPIQLL